MKKRHIQEDYLLMRNLNTVLYYDDIKNQILNVLFYKVTVRRKHVTLHGHIIVAYQSLMLLLKAACLAEKQQIQISISLVLPIKCSNPQPPVLGSNTLQRD